MKTWQGEITKTHDGHTIIPIITNDTQRFDSHHVGFIIDGTEYERRPNSEWQSTPEIAAASKLVYSMTDVDGTWAIKGDDTRRADIWNQ